VFVPAGQTRSAEATFEFGDPGDYQTSVDTDLI
jgi:hypothetical protein